MSYNDFHKAEVFASWESEGDMLDFKLSWESLEKIEQLENGNWIIETSDEEYPFEIAVYKLEKQY